MEDVVKNMQANPQNMRKTILKMAYTGQSVHIGCAFSLVEIVSVLYSHFLNITPSNFQNPERNILALSKGHGVMACYAALFELGVIDSHHITDYFKNGAALKGLSSVHCPGIEVSGGSLGHGITVATGMALAAKWKNSSKKIFCIVGDGEINEGSVWESFLFAAHHKLSNLIVIVDANQFQAMGRSQDVLNLEPLPQKLEAFGFVTAEVDGHNSVALKNTLQSLVQNTQERPKAIIARTTKGKGVSFMENDNRWHYSRLDDATFAAALAEVNHAR